MSTLNVENRSVSTWQPMLDEPKSLSPKSPQVPETSTYDFFRSTFENEREAGFGPLLMRPAAGASRQGAVDLLKELNGEGPATGKRKALGDGEINGVISAAAVLIAQFLTYYQKQFDNSIKLRNTMSQMNAQAIMGSADAMKRQGMANLMGSASGGMLQFGMAGAGMFKSLKGISGERDALKARTVAPGTPDTLSQTPTLPAASTVPEVTPSSSASRRASADLDAQADVPVSHAEVPTPAHAPESTLVPDPPSPNPDELGLAARRSQTQGHALTMLAAPTAGFATGTGRYSEMLAGQDQKLKDGASAVTKDSSNVMQEQSNRENTNISDMIRMIEAITQSKSSAMSTVAGNLRA